MFNQNANRCKHKETYETLQLNSIPDRTILIL